MKSSRQLSSFVNVFIPQSFSVYDTLNLKQKETEVEERRKWTSVAFFQLSYYVTNCLYQRQKPNKPWNHNHVVTNHYTTALTVNGKRQKIEYTAICSCSITQSSIHKNFLSCFYLLILYFEKFSTWLNYFTKCPILTSVQENHWPFRSLNK